MTVPFPDLHRYARDFITDYQHPLDPYGAHLGLDIGAVCTFGTTNITESLAYKYCSRIWGYSGVALFVVDAGSPHPPTPPAKHHPAKLNV